MRRMMGGSLYLVTGALVGIASAVVAVERFGAEAAAPGIVWDSWDVTEANRAQPYALAHFLIDGRFPPSAGQMLEFSTQQASDGGTLDAGCAYTVTAKSAPQQWWSLTAFASGTASGPSKAVLTADRAIADSDGALRMTVSRWPADGNWIRPPVPGSFALLLTVAEPSPNQADVALPLFTIAKAGC